MLSKTGSKSLLIMHLIVISESDLQEAQAFQEVVLVNVLDLKEAFFILNMLGFHCFHLV